MKRTAEQRMEDEEAEEENEVRRMQEPPRAPRRASAGEKARQEHGQYVARNYPRLVQEETPYLVRLSSESGVALADAPAVRPPEITFNMSGHVPFVGDPDLLDEFDLPYVERLNLTSWGYKDGCTAIILGKGRGRPFDPAALSSFAVYRGGKQYLVSPSVILSLPDWRTCPVFGTLCASHACRSLEFSLGYDTALRTPLPAGEPMQLRDKEYFMRFVDLRVFVRLERGDSRGVALVQAALAPGTYAVDAAADAADLGGSSFGAENRVFKAHDRIPLSAFVAAVEACREPSPVQWYCLAIGDPTMLCVNDSARVTRWLAAQVPHVPETYDSERAAVTSEFIADELFDPNVGAVLDADCDRWLHARGDMGMSAATAILLRRVLDPEVARGPCLALAALVKMRATCFEHRHEVTKVASRAPTRWTLPTTLTCSARSGCCAARRPPSAAPPSAAPRPAGSCSTSATLSSRPRSAAA